MYLHIEKEVTTKKRMSYICWLSVATTHPSSVFTSNRDHRRKHKWTQCRDEWDMESPSRQNYATVPTSVAQRTWRVRGQKDYKKQNTRKPSVKQSSLEMAVQTRS